MITSEYGVGDEDYVEHRWGSISHGFNLMMMVLMFMMIMMMMMMMMMMMTDVLPHAGMDIDGRG